MFKYANNNPIAVLAMDSSELMTIFIIIAVAFIPPILYLIWIRNTERFEREPWGKIAITFIWGAIFGVGLGLLFSYLLITAFGLAAPERVYSSIFEEEALGILILAVIIAPFAEEAAKAIGIFRAGKDLDEVEDGLIYGSSVGLGFAATENLAYGYIALAYGGVEAYVAIAFIRSISSTFLHASATSVTGYGIGKKMILGGTNKIWPYFLIAVFMHAVFNLFASMGTFFGLVLAIGFAFAAIEFTRHKIHQLDVEGMTKPGWRRGT
jgi:RsiW-degrading membrane proteinase PrsW (M82 family)